MTQATLTVNGRRVAVDAPARQHLADFLREREMLTATHLGCEHGVCGACTVLIDGAPARSCIAWPAALDGAEIVTVEGLDDDPLAARLRAAFTAEHALQCGYCTPGMLIMARDIARRVREPDEARIRAELSGNLCRCTGYAGIVRAIARVIGEGVDAAPPRRALSGTAPLAATVAAAAAPQKAEPAGAMTFSVEADGSTRIAQSFVTPFPRAAVWAFFQDPRKIVACMPGAALTRVEADGRIEGEMRVALGPISAAFAGEGAVSADPAAFSGAIEGQGAEGAGGTRATGRVTYALREEGPEATRVDVSVVYALTGPLAQISRGGVARDLAGRLTRVFADNLAASLAGRAPVEAAPLGAGALLWSMVVSRVRRLLGR
ncbi:MAG: hypothetical protein EA355_12480 [Rhodobacteraceae bacterium]|nr:MAG: hypothetical protein EA355_12480 [Paracoccaceae bacterium]